MKKIINRYVVIKITSIVMFLLLQASCKKDWLEKKPNSKLSVLTTLEEYQTLLDNSILYGGFSLASIGGDRYYIPERNQLSLDAQDASLYIWARDGYAGSGVGDWSFGYTAIFNCNKTIEGLSEIEKAQNPSLWNQVYGSALFYRGYSYYQLAQVFAKQYDSSTANADPGVPLRLTSNVNDIVGRGTVQQLYDQIVGDLSASVDLLPDTAATYRTRPGKVAAYAMLARCWLTIGDYAKAKTYAELALNINNTLIDYNTIAPAAALGFGNVPLNANPEVFFYTFTFHIDVSAPVAIIDSSLYASYSADDLRRSFFFRQRQPNEFSFKGTYRGQGGSASDLTTSPAVDELYLIRAEANARLGDADAAVRDLNALLEKRYIVNTFIPLVAGSPEDVLLKVLEEREKELVMRGVRWTDLRRLNKNPTFAVTNTRIFAGQTTTLSPNSNLYVYPIPNNEILYSGIEQNPR